MSQLADETIKAILERGRIYEVGGAVRDRLLYGVTASKDRDYLVTGVSYDELSRLLKRHGRVDLVGRSFGVIKYTQYHQGQGHTFDLTLPRREHSTGWGHKEFAVSFDPALTVEDDLVRRDFTVNAMALAIDSDELIDPLGGRLDLENRQLRMVYPTSFEDDPLRMLRAVQFAARFGFMIEPETFRAIRRNVKLIETVSAERIAEELNKLLMLAEQPSHGFRLMESLGLLKILLPELQAGIGVEQPGGYHKYDVFQHSLHTVDACAPRLRLRMAALFHDVSKPQARRLVEDGATFYGHESMGARVNGEILERLRYSHDFIRDVTSLIDRHMFTTDVTPKGMRRLLRRVGVELVFDLLDLRRADVAAQGMGGATEDVDRFETDIREELTRKPPLTVSDLALDGNDVMRLFSLRPGPTVGRVLSHLLEMVLDEPEANTPERLETLARKYHEDNEALSDNNSLKEHDL